jgi:ribosomal protein L37AE/L43A
MTYSKNDLDLISIREFAGRMAVLQATIKSALRVGTINKHKSSSRGHVIIDYTTEAPKFISASPNPSRYNPRAIKRRIELHPGLAHEYKKVNLRKKQIAERKKNKFVNPLEDRDGGSLQEDRLEKRRKGKRTDTLQKSQEDMLDTMSISTARASRELWRAKRERFKFEIEQGKFIDIDLVADDWEDLSTLFRIKLLELPDRIDAQITGLVRCECGNVKVDRIKINELLSNECKQILTGIAYDVRQKAKKYSKSSRKSRSSQEDEDDNED